MKIQSYNDLFYFIFIFYIYATCFFCNTGWWGQFFDLFDFYKILLHVICLSLLDYRYYILLHYLTLALQLYFIAYYISYILYIINIRLYTKLEHYLLSWSILLTFICWNAQAAAPRARKQRKWKQSFPTFRCTT